MVYFPRREITATPDERGLPYEDVRFETSDGIKLSGWFIPAREPRGVILFCHGNGGNISHRLDTIEIYYQLGLSTFIFDYRGFGKSEGKATEHGTYLDAEAAWNYLLREKNSTPAKSIIIGRSLGGPIAAWLAQKHPPGALIIESSFTSVPDIGAEQYPFLPVRWLARFDYPTMVYLRRIVCPVCIVHSPEDELIPFDHGLQLFETAKEPKKFLTISGDHDSGFLTSGKRYGEGIDSFLSQFAGM